MYVNIFPTINEVKQVMRNQVRKEKVAASQITFPPTEIVRIDDATVQRLLAEGMEFRRAIEKSAARMFVVSSSDSSTRMR